MKSKGTARVCMGLCLAAFLLSSAPARAEIAVYPTAEMGFLKALRHQIQIGEGTYEFDYVREGGQEILLPYSRFEVLATLGERHELAFLFQPLTLVTATRIDRAGGITIDDVVFADDTPLDLKYGFDFYRLTYRYRLLHESPWSFSLGAGLQLRNASIVFGGFDVDGNDARVITQDLGPVPVISLALRRSFGNERFLESTVEGFYAPVRYLNLRDVDVVGWLYDVSFRAGAPLAGYGEVFLVARFLGGGADGTAGERRFWTQSSADPRFTGNVLDLLILGLGARLALTE